MKKLTPLQKKLQLIENRHCIDCANAHNFHNIGANGEPIMCHCTNDKISHLLSEKACKKFTPIIQNNF